MTGLSFPHLNLPGLFEINETGTILYARTGPYEDTGPITDITGRNFFELAGPEIRIELRERIRRFVKSRNQADSFYVTHRLPVGDRRVKVVLGRIRHRSESYEATSVLIHFREA